MARALPLALVLSTLTLLAPPGSRAEFPEGFLWGSAISGFQTEMGGAPANIDPGTDWWVWTHDPDNLTNGLVSGDLPENGPGFYNRYADDIRLARRRLKLNAFRLGIEWSRIFPTSTAGVDTSGGVTLAALQQLDLLADQAAVLHYRAVLEELRFREMTPFVTLVHFTLPLWIHDPIAARDAFATVGGDDPPPTGFGPAGWVETAIIPEFEKYAAYVGWKFGDLVDYWTPLNEPMVIASSGYVNIPGVLSSGFPPAAFNFQATITVIVNEASGQRVAYDALKTWDTMDANGDGQSALAGLVHNMVFFRASRPLNQDDIAAVGHADYLFNRLWLNAVILGDVDANANGVIDSGEHHPELVGKADFVGVNYYFRGYVLSIGGPITPVLPLLDFIPIITPVPCPSTCSDLGWEAYPNGLSSVLATAGSYGLPLYITENGMADALDDRRPVFIAQHLIALERAITDGVADVRGYFHWSLIDNYEWASGYPPKFGLFRIEPDGARRKRRQSANMLARIARRNAVPQRLIDRYPF